MLGNWKSSCNDLILKDEDEVDEDEVTVVAEVKVEAKVEH